MRAVVPDGGKIGNALADDALHRLGDHSILEHRLGQIGHVIDNHLRTGRRQILDVLRENALSAQRGVECEAGRRRRIVDDLSHRPAFVGAAR